MDRHEKYRIQLYKNNNLKNVPIENRFFVSGKGYAFGLDTNICAFTSICKLQNVKFPFDMTDLIDIYCGYNVVYYITKYDIYSSLARSDDVLNSGRDISTVQHTGPENQKRIKCECHINKIHLSRNFTPSYYVKKIYTGENHSFILMNDSTLFCFGSNCYGQLGIDSANIHIIYPTIVNPENYGNEEIIDIACGYYHTTILTNKKNIYSSGRNDGHQIGGSDRLFRKFTKLDLSMLKSDEFVIKISSSSHNTCFLTNKGTLYGVGEDRFLTLGKKARIHFEPIEPFYSENQYVKNIWCSSIGSFVQLNNDTIYIVGQNRDAALFYGLTPTINLESYTKNTFLSGKHISNIEGFYTSIALDEKNENIYMSGNNRCSQILFSKSPLEYVPDYRNNEMSEIIKMYSHLDIHIESGFRVCSLTIRKKDGYTNDLCYMYINLHASIFGTNMCFSDISFNIVQ